MTKPLRLSPTQERILVEVVTGKRPTWRVPTPTGRALVDIGIMHREYARLGRDDYYPSAEGVALCIERGWVAEADVSPKVLEARDRFLRGVADD